MFDNFTKFLYRHWETDCWHLPCHFIVPAHFSAIFPQSFEESRVSPVWSFSTHHTCHWEMICYLPQAEVAKRLFETCQTAALKKWKNNLCRAFCVLQELCAKKQVQSQKQCCHPPIHTPLIMPNEHCKTKKIQVIFCQNIIR